MRGGIRHCRRTRTAYTGISPEASCCFTVVLICLHIKQDGSQTLREVWAVWFMSHARHILSLLRLAHVAVVNSVSEIYTQISM